MNKRLITIHIWSATTGEVQAKLKGHTGPVFSVVFSKDGTQVVSGLYDKTVQIWDLTKDQVQAELKGHTDWVRFIAFLQDGSQVVSGLDDKQATPVRCTVSHSCWMAPK